MNRNATPFVAGRSLLHGARMNGRVIVACIFLEAAKKFRGGPASYVWSVIEPSLLIALVLVVKTVFKGYTSAFGDNSIAFLLTGYITFRMIRLTINPSMKAIIANRNLLGLGHVKPPDVVIAKTVVEFINWVVILFLFFFGTSEVLGHSIIVDFQHFVLVLLEIYFFCLAMSMLNATLGVLIPLWATIWRISNVPALFLSGVIYAPSTMPPQFQAVLYWNPIVHCIEGLRSASYLDYLAMYDPIYLNSVSSVVLLTALLIERMFRREILKNKRVYTDEEDEF